MPPCLSIILYASGVLASIGIIVHPPPMIRHPSADMD